MSPQLINGVPEHRWLPQRKADTSSTQVRATTLRFRDHLATAIKRSDRHSNLRLCLAPIEPGGTELSPDEKRELEQKVESKTA